MNILIKISWITIEKGELNLKSLVVLNLYFSPLCNSSCVCNTTYELQLLFVIVLKIFVDMAM